MTTLNQTIAGLRLKQRPAAEQLAAGVSLPYFVHDLSKPVQWHMRILLLSPAELDWLVLYARKHAAKVSPNPLDNRVSLDYEPTDRERVDVLRHCAINRSSGNLHVLAGYTNSFDALLHRIKVKGVDVEARQLELRRHVLSLIAENYPHLATEAAYQYWLAETGLKNRRSAQ